MRNKVFGFVVLCLGRLVNAVVLLLLVAVTDLAALNGLRHLQHGRAIGLLWVAITWLAYKRAREQLDVFLGWWPSEDNTT